MLTINVCVLFFITISGRSLGSEYLSNLYVKDLEIWPCDRSDFSSISVHNLYIQIRLNRHFVLSGTIKTTEDLTSSVTASVTLKKKVAFFWIWIGCNNNVGSCNYDLCSYGYSSTQQCPSKLTKNHIPCRCPIPRGTYTLPLTEFEFSEDKSVLTGKYKGSVTIYNSRNTKLACYDFSFALEL